MKESSLAEHSNVNFIDAQLKFQRGAFEVIKRNLGPLIDFQKVNLAPLLDLPKLNLTPLIDFQKVNLAPLLDLPKLNLAPLIDFPRVNLARLLDFHKVNLPSLLDFPKGNLLPLLDFSQVNLAPLIDFPKVNLPPLLGFPKVNLAPLIEFPKLNLSGLFGSTFKPNSLWLDSLTNCYYETVGQFVSSLRDVEKLNSVLATIAEFNTNTLHPEIDENLGDFQEADADEVGRALQEMSFADLSADQKLNKLYEILTTPQSTSLSQHAKTLLMGLLIALLGWVLTQACDYYLKGYVVILFEKLPPQKQNKEIKQALVRDEPAISLYELRLVRRDTEGRSKYKSKSQLLAMLPRCKIVRLLKKRKKWALVEFESNHEIRQAWVRHKYIERILDRKPIPNPPTATVEEKFQRLADAWHNAVAHLSSSSKRENHPSYKEIIALGPPAVPLLLRDLEMNHRHWFTALALITGANPVPQEDAGKIPKMIETWLRWGKEQGYRW